MIDEDDNMKKTMPLPQSIAVVAVTTLSCAIVAWLLHGLVYTCVRSLHDSIGDAALPFFADMLATNRMVFWWVPLLAICVGAPLIVRKRHTAANLILYVTLFGFLALISTVFTVVAMVLPWIPIKIDIGS